MRGLPPIKLRKVRDTDWGLIYSDWKKSYRDGHPELCPGVPYSAAVYFDVMKRRIQSLKQRCDWVIACDEDDDNFILGWCCHEGPVLHYVYTRKGASDIYRHKGIAAQLTKHLPRPLVVTHWTRAAEVIQEKHAGDILYQPSRIPGGKAA